MCPVSSGQADSDAREAGQGGAGEKKIQLVSLAWQQPSQQQPRSRAMSAGQRLSVHCGQCISSVRKAGGMAVIMLHERQ